MQLILQVVQWPEGVEQRPQMAYFDADGGMIGRSETARLSLADPYRMVSRFHAHVSCRGDTYYLEDMGSTNPASVNGVVLGSNQQVQLRVGDAICIGGYTLAVSNNEGLVSKRDRPQSAAAQTQPESAALRRAPVEQDAVHTRFGPLEEDDIEVPVLSHESYPGVTLPQPDLMALSMVLPVSDAQASFAKVESFGQPSQAQAMAGLVSPDRAEQGEGSDAERAANEALLAQLWRAFQDGAQLSVQTHSSLKPEFMRSLGAMLRRAISGMRKLAKPFGAHGDGSGGVVLRSGNTLRLAADDTRAMLAALRPPVANFLTGPAAVDELMSSLEARHACTQAALRQAAEQLLQSLEPQALEKALDGAGRAGGLSLLRKARLWDLYAQQHRALVDQLGDGFLEAFERASRAQVERSRADEPNPPALARRS